MYPRLGSPQSPADGAFSPPRPPSHSQNGGTPSTLSTSPGESRNSNMARSSAQGTREESTGWKRARSGTTAPPPRPAPPRFSLPPSDGDRLMVNGTGTVHQTVGRMQQGQTRKSGSPDPKAIGRIGSFFCNSVLCITLQLKGKVHGIGVSLRCCFLVLYDVACPRSSRPRVLMKNETEGLWCYVSPSIAHLLATSLPRLYCGLPTSSRSRRSRSRPSSRIKIR